MSSVSDEIKSKLDIVDYIQQHVPDLKKAGRSYKACCPFHQERTPSFIVNPDTQTWRCFGACNEGGDLFSFAMKHHGWTFRESLEELGKLANVAVREVTPEQKARYEHDDRLRGLLQEAADAYHLCLADPQTDEARAALAYARTQRGFTMETIQQFGIGYAVPGWQGMLEHLTAIGYDEDDIIESGLAIRNDSGRVYDRFRDRLVIPIHDHRGRVVGFGGRALSPEDTPKYLNSPQTPVFDKSSLLFGLDVAMRSIRDSETAVIVEGYMDVIQAHQAGFTNVVAQMGTALTDGQLRLIAPRHARNIVLALDSDAAGQQATLRSLEVARQALKADFSGRLSVDIRILQIPGAKDPDDLLRESPGEWQALVDGAKPVADYVIDMEVAALSPDATVLEREAIARRLLPLLLASENNLYKENNVQLLALKLRISERQLLALVEEQRRIESAAPPRHDSPPDGPPPLSLDELEEPPAEWYEDAPPPDAEWSAQAPSVSAEHRQSEWFCLRLLLQNADWLYQMNRRLRELAGGNDDLINGPLAEFGYRDFVDADYYMLMQMMEAALAQDDMELLDFMRSRLDGNGLSDLAALLVDDPTMIQSRLKGRFKADFEVNWKQYVQRDLFRVDWEREFLDRGLALRQERLRRERQDFLFLTAQEQPGDMPVQNYDHQLRLSMQAKAVLDIELARIRNPMERIRPDDNEAK